MVWVEKQIRPRRTGTAADGTLLADFWTIFFGKIEITEWTMKIHP
jgi:hypothetical protein